MTAAACARKLAAEHPDEPPRAIHDRLLAAGYSVGFESTCKALRNVPTPKPHVEWDWIHVRVDRALRDSVERVSKCREGSVADFVRGALRKAVE